ncbi:MAG: hypothetical protein KDB79_08610 [Acidobacteria bacterium]|nr:hypothetical protein [Acidobacteriota bacterium]
MKIHELPFGKFIELNDVFVEVIIYEGVELTVEMLDQFQDYLVNKKSNLTGVLYNKINDYTYTFEAQMRLGQLPGIDAIAVVAYSQISRQVTESIIKMSRNSSWNIRVFDNRKDAIGWLRKELGELEKPASGSAF